MVVAVVVVAVVDGGFAMASTAQLISLASVLMRQLSEVVWFFDFPLVFDFVRFYWVLLGFTLFYLILLRFTRVHWVLLGFTGFYWVLLGFTGFFLVLPTWTWF